MGAVMNPKDIYRQWSKIVRRTEDGEPCLPWDRLPDRIRAAWIAIAPAPVAPPAEPAPAPVPDPPAEPPKRKPRKRA